VAPSISGIADPTSECVSEQTEKIVRSKLFRNAPSLQRLLLFVTATAAQGQADHIKELTIAAEVFGRAADYDPKVDTSVRVEMHRLREKLREYYETEGTRDCILIDIPKGHYLPTFVARTETTPLQSRSPKHPDSTPQDVERLQAQGREGELVRHPGTTARRVSLRRIGAVAVSFSLFLCGLIVGVRWEKSASRNSSAAPSAAATHFASQGDAVVEEFWRDFLGNDSAPVVGYSDAVFLIDETNNLFRFRRGASDARGAPVDPYLALRYASNPLLVAKAGPLFYEDGYTGTGEVESIARLAHLFTLMNLQMTVKRCREVTIDDLKEHSVILLGASFQNKVVGQLPSAGDFVFDNPEERRELWMGRIMNLHPADGEKAVYKTERDPATQVVKTDYALITVQPGVGPGRLIVLGGLDTAGTKGAVEFATSRMGIEELLNRLKPLGEQARQRRLPLFQALLRVDLRDGHDVMSAHLVAVHLIRPK